MSTKIPDEVQVIESPRPGRRRRYTAQERLSFLQEAEAPGSSVSAVARRYGIARACSSAGGVSETKAH